MEKCPQCYGHGRTLDHDGDPVVCPECLGCVLTPATADDALALVKGAA